MMRHPPWKTTLSFPALVLLAWSSSLSALSQPAGAPGWRDAGFEILPTGRLDTTGCSEGWEIQRQGREAIRDRLAVACLDDAALARSGGRCLSLSIPEETVGFEFVTVGQRVTLEDSREYEASVWVRWLEGPEAAPATARPSAARRSAIVSFWARHRDGRGHFAGRDVWLFDNQWRRLTFRFRATDPGERTLVYVSLLPNQTPAATTVLVDDFELSRSPGAVERELRADSITLDPGFENQLPPSIAPPWGFSNRGGTGIRGQILREAGETFAQLAMGETTSNYESAQLWQPVDLHEGARYEVSCRIRWDNVAQGSPVPIVNYGIYHEASNTWYGPVDQVLEATAEWRTYRFTHVPPYPGPWKLYVQLNGWGNFERAVTVSFDDFHCEAVPTAR